MTMMTSMKQIRWNRRGYGFVLPAIGLLTMLVILPAVAVIVLSCTRWLFGSASIQVVGTANYRALLHDATFWSSVRTTVVFGLLVVLGSILSGLLVAILIDEEPYFKRTLRTLHLLPFIATLSATALAWEALLHPMVGLVNMTLAHVGLSGMNWLHNPETALLSLAVIAIWQNFGYAAALFLAALQVIPTELYEAAALDGIQTLLGRVRLIVLPLLGPSILFATVVTAIRASQTFDSVALLTQGGPNGATDLLLYRIYQENFHYFRVGYGAALTTVFLLLFGVLTAVQLVFMSRRVHFR